MESEVFALFCWDEGAVKAAIQLGVLKQLYWNARYVVVRLDLVCLNAFDYPPF